MEIKLLQIKESTGKTISSPGEVYEVMREESKADRECLWVLHLNAKNRIIEKELVSMGTLNASLVTPREVFKRAILNSASGIIVVHNHPSGIPEPSSDDLTVRRALEQAGDLLGISLLDFIIIAPSGKFASAKCDKSEP